MVAFRYFTRTASKTLKLIFLFNWSLFLITQWNCTSIGLCNFVLPDIWRHHVLVHSDSRYMVSYINHQGGHVWSDWRATFLCGLRTICAHWRRRMCRARWTMEQTCFKEQRLPRGLDAPPTRGSLRYGMSTAFLAVHRAALLSCFFEESWDVAAKQPLI